LGNSPGILTTEFVNGWNNARAEQLVRAVELANKGIEVDSGDPWSYVALAYGHLYLKQFGEAERAAERSIELAPNFAAGHGILGRVRDYAGSPADAIDCFETALRLDPQVPDIYLQFLGHAQFSLGRYTEAEATFKRRLIRNPHSDVSRVFLASLYGHTCRLEEARTAWREALEINPEYPLERMRAVVPYKDPSRFDFLLDGLCKAGLPE
jgi:adenylate cyclase